MRKNNMLVCYNKKCEKTPCSYAARFSPKNDFLVPYYRQKIFKKVPKTHNFEGSSEISAGPKNKYVYNKIFILMCSKRFTSWLVIWAPQKKALYKKCLYQQNFPFFSQKFSCGCRNFWVPWYPKKVFFEKSMG